jgi:anti-sigma factor RsiW
VIRSVSCRELAEFLDDYLSGELPAETVAAFDAHLRLCPACVAYLNSYRHATTAAKAALRRADEIASELPEELVAAILGAAR